MSGISNYYDGETGVIKDIFWEFDDESLSLTIQIDNNPHRIYASDYGSDIGIDPNLKTGQIATYRQIDSYAGLWVENTVFQNLEDFDLMELEDFQSFPNLDNAVKRVIDNRKRYLDFSDFNQESIKKLGIFQRFSHFPIIRQLKYYRDKNHRIDTFAQSSDIDKEISKIVESSKIPFRWGGVCYLPESPKIQIRLVQLIIPDSKTTERLLVILMI